LFCGSFFCSLVLPLLLRFWQALDEGGRRAASSSISRNAASTPSNLLESAARPPERWPLSGDYAIEVALDAVIINRDGVFSMDSRSGGLVCLHRYRGSAPEERRESRALTHCVKFPSYFTPRLDIEQTFTYAQLVVVSGGVSPCVNWLGTP
jgi:hypothetical protein